MGSTVCTFQHSFESHQNTRNRPLSSLLSNKYLCVCVCEACSDLHNMWKSSYCRSFVRPEVPNVVTIKIPYLLVCDTMLSCRYLPMIWRNVLPASSGKVSMEERYGHTQREYWDWYHFPVLGYPPTLNLEAACLSKKPVMIYQTTRNHILERRSLTIVFLVLVWDWRNIPCLHLWKITSC